MIEDLCVPTFFFSHFLGHFDETSWKIEVVIVGTPLEPTWHTTSIRINSIHVPQGGHVARQLYPGPTGGHTTLSNIILGRCSILSGYIVRIIDRKKQVMMCHLRQSITAHVPPPAERKDGNDGKSPPTISDSRL